MNARIFTVVAALLMLVMGVCGQAAAVVAYSTPPSYMPMIMLNISYNSSTDKLAITTNSTLVRLYTNTTAAGSPTAPGVASFDPAQPYAVLNNTAFSRMWGWDDGTPTYDILSQVQAAYGPDAGIWIKSLKKSDGLDCYQAVGQMGTGSGVAPLLPGVYPGIFGTGGSSVMWQWDGSMAHNTYAVPFSKITRPDQPFSAYYGIYIGNAAGKELRKDSAGVVYTEGAAGFAALPSAHTTTTWLWQGPSFVFTSKSGVATGTTVESDVFTFNPSPVASAPIAITGGEYAISTDGGVNWGAWTAAAGTINPGNMVKVRLTSSPTAGTRTFATLSIPTAYGPGTFSVTTLGAVTTPAAFTFNSVNSAAVSTYVESGAITVSGITAPAPVAITGGEYAVSTDGGASWGSWAAAAGTVENGNQVKVRLLTSPDPGVTTFATLTIGGVKADFVVTTSTTVAPSAWFTPVTNVPADTALYASPYYTVSNPYLVTADSTISIVGGIKPGYAVSKDGGQTWSAWSTTTPATVTAGHQVKVRVVPATTAFTESITRLNLGSTVVAFSVTTGYKNPPFWMPMAMLNVAFDPAAGKLSVQDQATHPSFANGNLPLLTYVKDGSYDPTKSWSVLNGGMSLSRQLGWDDNTALHGNGIHVPGTILTLVKAKYGADAGIWIERLSQTSGLATYFADGMFGVGGTGNGASGTPQPYTDPVTGLPIIYSDNYYGVFGTGGSSNRWQWDGTMIHNAYAVPAGFIHTPNQLFSANYRVYVGDSQGNDLDGAAATTTTWSWQGPSLVFPTKIEQKAGAAVTSAYVDLALIPGVPAGNHPISITGGKYSIWTPTGGWSAYTSAPGTITNLDAVRVQVTAATTPGGTASATVSLPILNGPGTFKVVTAQTAGSLPTYTFAGVTGADPGATVESVDTYTVTGIPGASATAGVSSGALAVSSDGGMTWGPWVSVSEVVNGDRIKVRVTASGTANGAASTTMTIVGVVSGTFTVTTNAYSAPPTWQMMAMLNLSLTNGKLGIQDISEHSRWKGTVPATYPVLCGSTPPSATSPPMVGPDRYDPAKPWSMLNSTAFSRQLGWDTATLDEATIKAAFGPNAGIWIEKLWSTPGLESYLAVGFYGVNINGTTAVDTALNPPAYSGLFGTAGSSTRWKWDYQMDHNTYAVSSAYLTPGKNQYFSARYRIYIGDDQGNDIAPAAATETTWTWQTVYPVKVTVATSPAGQKIIADGVTYTAPVAFSWIPGEKHTIAVASSQEVAGTRYAFASWSDGGAQSHEITVPAAAATLTANLTATHYQLTTAVTPAGTGWVSPASGSWYPANTVANLKATPNTGYSFASWTGPVANPASAATTITMDGPKAVTANLVGGTPVLTASITGKAGTVGARTWTISLRNSGTGAATGAGFGLALKQTAGAACSPKIITPLPLTVGDIAAGAAGSGSVTIDFTGCANAAKFTATIPCSANAGAVTGSKVFVNQFR